MMHMPCSHRSPALAATLLRLRFCSLLGARCPTPYPPHSPPTPFKPWSVRPHASIGLTRLWPLARGSGIYGHPAHSGIYGHPAQSGNGIVASGGGSTLPGKSAGATPLEEPRYEAPSASPVSPTTPGASPAAPSVTFLNVQAASPDYISDEPAVSACLVRNTAAPPSVGERAAAGVDALLMELRKVDSIFTKDDGATALVTHVTKTAKVGQTLMPLIPPVTAEVVASDTTYAAHIQTRTQRLAAVLPEFVKAGIALKELLCDKEALEAEGGTFLHHECYVRLCEQAFALSHCFRDIWQGLGMYRLLKVAKTKTTGHEAVHTILRRLDGHLAELVGSVNANDTKAYIEMTRPIMVFGAQLMKAVAAASEEIGVGVVGEAIGFYQEPRVMAARERLANSITELLSATKASVGVWPGPHASQVGQGRREVTLAVVLRATSYWLSQLMNSLASPLPATLCSPEGCPSLRLRGNHRDDPLSRSCPNHADSLGENVFLLPC